MLYTLTKLTDGFQKMVIEQHLFILYGKRNILKSLTVIHPDQKETFCGCVLFGRMLNNHFLTYPLSKTSYSGIY